MAAMRKMGSHLRTANEKMAKDKATQMYEDMYFRQEHGLTAVVVLFKDAADTWLKELRAGVRAGSRNAARLGTYFVMIYSVEATKVNK